MAQNYRNPSGRSDYGRGGRYQTGSDRDRYQTGGEQRYNPEWDDRHPSRGFEGDRGYSAGGYAEEFGYRGGQNRDAQDRDYRSNNDQGRGFAGGSDQSGRGFGGDYGREGRSRYDEGHFDEANRWSEGAGGRDLNDLYGQRTSTSRWHEDQGDRGGYFNTGSYIDDGGASRGFGSEFERARRQTQQRYGSGSSRGTSGDFSNYGRSYYGAQGGYGRGEGQDNPPWSSQQRGGNYEERSGWDYGQSRRGGSGSSSGAYGYDAGYRSDYGSSAGAQSHRGRGPQGYQRSDERLKEMICERLTDDPAIDATNVTVNVSSQVVKLTGTVDDRRTKYEIEELIERLGGVKDIDNQLRVQSSSNSQSSSQQNSASGQQLRGGSDWEAGSSSLSSSGTASPRAGTAGTTGSSATSGTSSSKRN